MKWLIASDIHGASDYCKKLIERYEIESADKILLLGDILYHGPRNALPKEYNPTEVINMLNAKRNDILAVRGNCDTEVDQMVLDFPIMAEYAIITVGERMIFATHGHNFNKNNLPPLHTGDILLHGHTHIPVCEEFNNYVYCNPGSVSIPKEDSPNSYMILENGEFLWKTLDGEVYKKYKIL